MRRHLFSLAGWMTLLLLAAQAAPNPEFKPFLFSHLGHGEYIIVRTALHEGGREIFVYDSAPAFCGSGGCTLFVFEPVGKAYRRIAWVPVSRLPIRVLESTSNGWHDLAVRRAGGGRPARWERLRFDGHRYHGSAEVAREDEAGRTVIATDAKPESF